MIKRVILNIKHLSFSVFAVSLLGTAACSLADNLDGTRLVFERAAPVLQQSMEHIKPATVEWFGTEALPIKGYALSNAAVPYAQLEAVHAGLASVMRQSGLTFAEDQQADGAFNEGRTGYAGGRPPVVCVIATANNTMADLPDDFDLEAYLAKESSNQEVFTVQLSCGRKDQTP